MIGEIGNLHIYEDLEMRKTMITGRYVEKRGHLLNDDYPFRRNAYLQVIVCF